MTPLVTAVLATTLVVLFAVTHVRANHCQLLVSTLACHVRLLRFWIREEPLAASGFEGAVVLVYVTQYNGDSQVNQESPRVVARIVVLFFG